MHIKMNDQKNLKTKINALIWFFIIGLVLSGLTAFPLETELAMLKIFFSGSNSDLNFWITRVHDGLKETNTHYPFLAYGTDWLAFAHLVIAVAFIGPLRDPVKNSWIIEFGMIACLMVLPLAFIAGYIREIPLYWRLIDCSFGLIGIIPLLYCRSLIKELEKKQRNENNN
jgi:hypothetical protein